jgi:hypothetical protein
LNFSLPPRNPIRECSSKYERRDVPQGQEGEYLALAPGNPDQLALAIYLFGAIGIGIKFPNTAMDQFNAGKPWDVANNAKIEGGHYILGVGRDAKGNFVVVTWGKIQLMTPRFYKKYCDEVVAYVSDEALLAGGKTLDGFNLAELQADLNALPKA